MRRRFADDDDDDDENPDPVLMQKFVWLSTTTLDPDGRTTRGRKISFEAEDIIAFTACIVAILFAIAMIAGWIPINKYTAGTVTCAGAGGVIAKIVKARRQPKASG